MASALLTEDEGASLAGSDAVLGDEVGWAAITLMGLGKLLFHLRVNGNLHNMYFRPPHEILAKALHTSSFLSL